MRWLRECRDACVSHFDQCTLCGKCILTVHAKRKANQRQGIWQLERFRDEIIKDRDVLSDLGRRRNIFRREACCKLNSGRNTEALQDRWNTHRRWYGRQCPVGKLWKAPSLHWSVSLWCKGCYGTPSHRMALAFQISSSWIISEGFPRYLKVRSQLESLSYPALMQALTKWKK